MTYASACLDISSLATPTARYDSIPFETGVVYPPPHYGQQLNEVRSSQGAVELEHENYTSSSSMIPLFVIPDFLSSWGALVLSCRRTRFMIPSPNTIGTWYVIRSSRLVKGERCVSAWARTFRDTRYFILLSYQLNLQLSLFLRYIERLKENDFINISFKQ